MPEKQQKVFLFIDADNICPTSIDRIVELVSKKGLVVQIKAYANWIRMGKKWESVVNCHHIKSLQFHDYTPGKNAADIALAIDVMDCLYLENPDVICVASNDCDFSPIAERIKNTTVNCFLYIDKEKTNTSGHSLFDGVYQVNNAMTDQLSIKLPTGVVLNQDTIELIERIVSSFQKNPDDWVELSPISIKLTEHAAASTYGFSHWKSVLKLIPTLEYMKENHLTYFRFKAGRLG